MATVATGWVAGGTLVVPSHCREPSLSTVFSVNWYTEKASSGGALLVTVTLIVLVDGCGPVPSPLASTQALWPWPACQPVGEYM